MAGSGRRAVYLGVTVFPSVMHATSACHVIVIGRVGEEGVCGGPVTVRVSGYGGPGV